MRNEWEFNYEVTVLMSSSLLVKAYGLLWMNTGPSLLWHAEPITQTDTRPFCSTLTHDHRIAHAYSLHLTCVNWLCHQILNEPQQTCMCRLSVSKITRLVTAGFVCVQSNCQGHQCSVDRELWERSSLEFSTQSDGSLRLSTFRYVLSIFVPSTIKSIPFPSCRLPISAHPTAINWPAHIAQALQHEDFSVFWKPL